MTRQTRSTRVCQLSASGPAGWTVSSGPSSTCPAGSVYNYGVSQHFKAWVDLVIAGAGATTPVLKGKPTVVATVRGGGYGPRTPREG
jgi:FMN-dependent NADH-azoreductase